MAILPSNPTTWTLDTVTVLINNITKLALLLAGGVAIIFILIGAFEYLTAYGNEEKANKGKTTIMWAVIGIVVILLAELIVALLQSVLK